MGVFETMARYIVDVENFLVTNRGNQKINLKIIGLHASSKKAEKESKGTSAKTTKSPEKAFINHLSSNSSSWAKVLWVNRSSLSQDVISLFHLSRSLRQEYEILKRRSSE